MILFKFDGWDITLRELILSVSIIAILIIIGLKISYKITDDIETQNLRYEQAVEINSDEMFTYALDTNIGDVFAYGELKAVDSVTSTDIKGEYMLICKKIEEYTRHTREVKDKNGKKKEEVYYTWDLKDTKVKKSKEVKFCGEIFSTDLFELPEQRYVGTKYKYNNLRYLYYVVDTNYKGTVFSTINNRTISEKTKFYNEMTPEQTKSSLKNNNSVVVCIFWIFWGTMIGVIVTGFYYIDNSWLE